MLAVSMVDDVLESVNADLFILLIDPGYELVRIAMWSLGFLETLKTPDSDANGRTTSPYADNKVGPKAAVEYLARKNERVSQQRLSRDEVLIHDYPVISPIKR